MSLLSKWRRFKNKIKKKKNRITHTGKFLSFKLRKDKVNKKKLGEGTMGQPFTDEWGQPINPDVGIKKKVKVNRLNTRKYDYWAQKKYKRDYDDLGPLKKKSIRKIVRRKSGDKVGFPLFNRRKNKRKRNRNKNRDTGLNIQMY